MSTRICDDALRIGADNLNDAGLHGFGRLGCCLQEARFDRFSKYDLLHCDMGKRSSCGRTLPEATKKTTAWVNQAVVLCRLRRAVVDKGLLLFGLYFKSSADS